VKEIESPSKHDKIISTIINHVLEKPQKARLLCAKLMAEVVRLGVISREKYLQGWADILEYADDLATDIPNIWTYFAELIGPSLLCGALPMGALKDICVLCVPCAKAHVLAASVLSFMVKEQSQDEVLKMWTQGQIQWDDLIPAPCNLQEFLQSHNLDAFNASELPMSVIKSELARIVQPKASNEEICKWIDENVTEKQRQDPQFVRALMSAVCSSVITEHESKKQLNEKALKDRCTSILQKYLDHDGDRELQALYALQALMVQMQHPQGLLRTFFDVLYDEDLISEDSFFKWDSSDDPAEAGKGVARHSVRQFFTWLHEPSEDQDEA
jgi:translation initiation factor 4G